MASAYFVIRQSARWKIMHDNAYFGPYPNREAAIQIAVSAAKREMAGGADTHVLVQRDNGKFYVEWAPDGTPRRHISN